MAAMIPADAQTIGITDGDVTVVSGLSFFSSSVMVMAVVTIMAVADATMTVVTAASTSSAVAETIVVNG